MIKRFSFLTICSFFLLFPSSLLAQSPLKIGQWQSHYAYQYGEYVAQSETHVFYGNNQGILKIDKVSREIDRLSTVDGLTESGMGFLKYDSFNKLLITTYFNGNIDFLYDDGRIFNLPFIATSSQLGDKTINDILIDTDTSAYISMGFGMKILNVRDQEFGDETQAGIPFNQIAKFHNNIYAATAEGIYRFALDEEKNIQDFSNWSYLGEEDGFPADYATRNIASYKDRLYFDVNDTIYRYDEVNLQPVYTSENFGAEYMTTEGLHLMVGLRCGDQSCHGKVVLLDENGVVKTINSDTGCINRPEYGVEDTQGRIYFAENWDKYRLLEAGEYSCEAFAINSPLNWRANELKLVDEELWVAPEIPIDGIDFTDRGFYSYIDGKWTNYYSPDHPLLAINKAVYRIAVSPDKKSVYFGTRWTNGLLKLDRETQQVEVIPNEVAKLKPSGDAARTRVSGLAYDDNNILWIGNDTEDAKGLIALKPDGSFTDNFLTLPSRATSKIIVDNEGYLWIASSDLGFVIYDYAGTVDDISDDRLRSITTNNSVLPSNEIRSIAIDLDGSVWVGTRNGAVVFECQGDPFNTNCAGNHPRVVVNNIPALLLDEVKVNAIAIDAANRKWFGTPSGIFVQSPDGSERLATFDEDNSPIFNNAINDIAINRESGLVFISTGNGLISYKTDAAGIASTHNSDIKAFPNPVRPEYDGPIAIRGFARDSNIKITDINGKLVYETTALGGQAIWDGRDYNGRKAQSGVYLVYATRTSNRDFPDAVVTKILVMN